MKSICLSAAILLNLVLFSASEACTRALFIGSADTVITGRSMDWHEDLHSDLWVFPRGMQREGAAGPNSVSWTSTYGSLIVSGYNAGTADGINERGLVANVLYLAESQYEKPDSKRPLMSIAVWPQFALDNYATVAETVAGLRKNAFIVLAPMLPNGEMAQFHLSVSDPSGDSAIFEYLQGQLVIHHGKEYQIMTNSPSYDQQLALNSYWEKIGGLKFLPGTNSAADRFARASFLLGVLPKEVDPHFIQAVPGQTYDHQAVASVVSVMRSVSVPLGITTPGAPNIASTLWRTAADHKNKIYYFDSATSPNTFWVSLADLDFTKGTPVKKLKVSGGKIYSGNAAARFEKADPFKFLPVTKN
jgi:penicillin V acylase-like amidase (Ntn superfamily)